MKTILFCAQSLDGKIAKNDKDPIDWTGSEDKKLFAQETKKAGVVIMGRKTHEAIGRPLKDRLNVVLTRRPRKRLNQEGLLEFTRDNPKVIIEKLKRRGFKKVFVIGGAEIFTLFLKERLITEIWISIIPTIFGGGLSLVSSPINEKIKFNSLKMLANGAVLLKYRL